MGGEMKKSLGETQRKGERKKKKREKDSGLLRADCRPPGRPF